jgi:uncharacterized repeat protein (TIGR01451 family)
MHARSPSMLWVVVFVIAVMALSLGVSVVLAGPLDQPPPPPPPPPPGTDTGGNGTGFLAELEGYVWENGDPQKPVNGVVVRFTSDGISVDATTDPRGHFQFFNLGPDVGTLDLADSKWQSGTGGVILQPPPGRKLKANLAALPKGKALPSLVSLVSSTSSSRAVAGETITFSLKVANGTQAAISGLTLGDQLPDGMTVLGVTTSRGDVVGRSANAVTVDLNTLAPGDSATVTIVAQVAQDAKTSVSANRATVFYSEGPAASSSGKVGVLSGPQALPVTGIGLPILAVVVLAAILVLARKLRVKPTA